MSNTYLTKIHGSVELLSEVKVETLELIESFIELHFNNLMNLDKETGIIYINGDFDNEYEIVEKFLSKIFNYINITTETIIETQGEDLKDRYDIVIRNGGVFIQEYIFKKGNLKMFVPMG